MFIGTIYVNVFSDTCLAARLCFRYNWYQQIRLHLVGQLIWNTSKLRRIQQRRVTWWTQQIKMHSDFSETFLLFSILNPFTHSTLEADMIRISWCFPPQFPPLDSPLFTTRIDIDFPRTGVSVVHRALHCTPRHSLTLPSTPWHTQGTVYEFSTDCKFLKTDKPDWWSLNYVNIASWAQHSISH